MERPTAMLVPLKEGEIKFLLSILGEQAEALSVRKALTRWLKFFDRTPEEQAYLKAAIEKSIDGEIEVDDLATVSMNDEYGGAYVAAWMWVSPEEAVLDETLP